MSRTSAVEPRDPSQEHALTPGAHGTAALAGDRRALGRLLTVLEAGGLGAATALRQVYPLAGQAHLLGVTGPAGAGKSTLVAALVRHLREAGHRVGVLAVDPTSPYTGGALLGDRIRMTDVATDPGVFVRSLATRGAPGGLSLAAAACASALDAAGYRRIVIETVGAGQDELAIASVADTTLLVLEPGMGDAIQALKAGLLEIADVLVVNKADLPDADRALAELRALQSLAPAAGWEPPVLATVATRAQGVAAVAEAVEAHRAYLRGSSEGPRRARARATASVLAVAQAALAARLQRLAQAPEWEPALRAVAQHERSAYDVANELLAALDPVAGDTRGRA